MSLQTPSDLPVQVIVPNDTNPSGPPLLSAERRVTLSWTVAQFKAKLEPITGIPAASQSLRTRSLLVDDTWIPIDNDADLLSTPRYGLKRGSEIQVIDLRPRHERQNLNFLAADLSSVEKYQMPEDRYEKLEDSVLAWKRRQKLGRFDPHAKSQDQVVQERRKKDEAEMAARGIRTGLRCRVAKDDGKRGVVRFTGEVPGLGGQREEGCLWVGVELDEPVGRNDGSVPVEIEGEDGKPKHETRRVFECRPKYGVLARPEKVEVGEFPPLDDLMDEDMEEI
ncbi:putative cell polarity protein (Alp11) [Cladophialophora carrionii]|uniref:Putative cell polarity protein (Alp11) n=1 Tax=Cladophialophora carrionii TaxID=86049 RepID=A0A1C1CAH6_9EURO|nr:putative cell polarity protein (Alp11) [Cladophialophora carrionii]